LKNRAVTGLSGRGFLKQNSSKSDQ